jgi:hemerythrin superfamily protein
LSAQPAAPQGPQGFALDPSKEHSMHAIDCDRDRRRLTVLTGAAALGLFLPMGAISRPAAAQPAPVPAAGAPTGDIFQMLIQEHRQVEALFAQLVKTGDADVQARTDLLMQLNKALLLHGLAEENAIYPAMHVANMEETSEDLFEEHADIKIYLFQLEQMPKNSPDWLKKARDFQEHVQEHVEDEDKNAFPKLRDKLTPEQLTAVTAVARRARQC